MLNELVMCTLCALMSMPYYSCTPYRISNVGDKATNNLWYSVLFCHAEVLLLVVQVSSYLEKILNVCTLNTSLEKKSNFHYYTQTSIMCQCFMIHLNHTFSFNSYKALCTQISFKRKRILLLNLKCNQLYKLSHTSATQV